MIEYREIGIGIASLLFAVSSIAAEDPVGEWKGEGGRGEITIIISTGADGSLGGQMITQRGPNDLSSVKMEGAQLSFTNLLEFNGQSIELNFTGDIVGDKFTGTISTPRGERPIELTRAVEFAGIDGLVGVWKLTGESRYGPTEHRFVVTADGKGTYESGGQVSEVTSLVIKGNEVGFDVTIFGGGGSYDVAFEGSFGKEGLSGDIITNGASFVALKAPRVGAFDEMIGIWNLTGESQFGPMEHTLIVTPDGKFTYGSDGQVSEISELKIDGNSISFNMTVFGGGGEYPVAFEGIFGDDGLSGDVMTNGTSFSALTAPAPK
ncbi:MAG TPA: hypothetical protein EYN96_03810 [Candidatus Hydrogenedentes bacterium]|jgi:hypothetical protein|nr:hypothetical protein [Candidatus Hydrogenedentota bacterium]